jgi:DNA-binding Lrp family transcriptional regulator
MVACDYDEIDLRIIKSFSEDCRKSTTQVAKEAGISRPTAISRIKSLAANQLLDFGAKVNVAKMGFRLAILTLESDKAEEDKNLINKLSICPRVLQLIQIVGKPSYTAIVVAENADTLLSAIECLRSVMNARIVSWQRAKPVLGESFNLKILLEKCEFTPCGKKCGLCASYKESACLGCPATEEYRGPL